MELNVTNELSVAPAMDIETIIDYAGAVDNAESIDDFGMSREAALAISSGDLVKESSLVQTEKPTDDLFTAVGATVLRAVSIGKYYGMTADDLKQAIGIATDQAMSKCIQRGINGIVESLGFNSEHAFMPMND